jgi:hypothetical protein
LQPSLYVAGSRIAHLLPPSATTLCLLSCFSDDELAAALDAGIIHPGATRAAITAWRRCRCDGPTGDQNPDAAVMVVHAVIYWPSNARAITAMFCNSRASAAGLSAVN